MRGPLLAGLAAALTAAGCAQNGQFRRADPGCDCAPRPEPRFPFLATVMQPARDYAPRGPNGRPMVGAALAAETAFAVMTFSSNPAVMAVGLAAPATIRLSRVLLFGSPVPGPPRDTLLWIASPYLLGLRNAVRERRGVPADEPVPVSGPPVIYYGHPP